MRQKTKAKILTAYFFGICFLAFSNLSCSGDVETNTTNLGNGDVSGIITDDNNSPTDYQTVSCTLTPKQWNDGTANISTSLRYAAAKITGRILDAKNGKKPLEGASVSIGGEAVQTNSDGIFTISQLPLDNYTITITYCDYKPQTREVKADDFVDGVAQLSDILLGGEEVLPGLTLSDLKECTPWMYNEYRGGRNADNCPQFDWSVDYMCTLDMIGNWEEQNEGTTMRVNESNGIDLDNLNTFIYGRKHITEDNKIMTVFARTHQYFQPTKESKVDELTEGPDGTIKFNHKNGDENKVTIYSIDLNKIII